MRKQNIHQIIYNKRNVQMGQPKTQQNYGLQIKTNDKETERENWTTENKTDQQIFKQFVKSIKTTE